MTEVIYIKDAFAYTDGEKIYMHEDLKNYPLLHQAVLEHEQRHDDKWFSIKDFINDLTVKLPNDEFKAFKKSHMDIMYKSLLPVRKQGINVNIIIIYILSIALVYSVMSGVLWLSQNLL